MIVALMYGMMVNAPIAQFCNAPPENELSKPMAPPPELREASSTALFNVAPSNPGRWMYAVKRQIARTTTVKIIRDFNSGILKQLLKVLTMERNMARLKPSQFQLFLP